MTAATLTEPLKDTGHEPLKNTDQAAEYLNIRPQTLALWRMNNTHPDLLYIKVGRFIRYRKSDLDAWLESRTVGSK